MKAWLKGALAGLIISIIVIVYNVISYAGSKYGLPSSAYTELPILSIILIFTGILLGFFHSKLKLNNYKLLYLFYFVSFTWLAIFVMLWYIRIGFEDFLFFIIFPFASLILGTIYFRFERKKIQIGLFGYLSVYISVISILTLIIISVLLVPEIVRGGLEAGGEGLLVVYLTLLFSTGGLILSLVLSFIDWIVGKNKQQPIQTQSQIQPQV